MLIDILGIYFHVFELPLLCLLGIGVFFQLYEGRTIIKTSDKKNMQILFWGLILYVFAIGLSIIGAIDHFLVIKSVIKWLEVYLIVTLVVIYVSNFGRFKYIYWTLFVSTFISLLVVLFRIVAGEGVLFSARTFPGYESVIAFSLLLPFVGWRNGKFAGTLLAICIVGVIFSFTRSAYLALLSCILYSFYLQKKFKTLLIRVGFILVIVFSIPYSREIISGVWQFFSSNKTGSNTERIVLAQLAIKAFISSPLTGVGSLNFPLFSFGQGVPKGIISKNIDTLGPHNAFLQVAAEEGLLGLIFFCLVLFASIKLLKNVDRLSKVKSKYICGLHYLFIVMFLNFLFGFITSAYRFYFAIFLGLSAAATRVFQKPNSVEFLDFEK